MDRSLTRVRNVWDTLGEIDPMWAIDTDPKKFGLKWVPEDFFAVGKREIDAVMAKVRPLVPSMGRERALDFGCGLGRLARALSEHYERVDGVDVARSMIDLANEHNVHRERCNFVLNEAPDLRVFADESFDFIYSNIVLQHMPPKLAVGYIREFARCTKRSGAIVFQVPHARRLNKASFKRGVRHAVYALLPKSVVSAYRRRKNKALPRDILDRLPKITMEMHCVSQQRILATLKSSCRLVAIADTSGPNDAFVSKNYVFEKVK